MSASEEIALTGCTTIDPKVIQSKTTDKSIVVAANVDSVLIELSRPHLAYRQNAQLDQ